MLKYKNYEKALLSINGLMLKNMFRKFQEHESECSILD